MRLFWGLIVLTIGLVFLGQNLNFWGPSQIEQLMQYWPILVILFGIAIMVRHLKLGWLIILISFIAGLIFVYLISFSPITSKNSIFNNQVETSNFSSNVPEGTQKAKIIVDTGAVSLKISDTSDKLIEGTLESRYLEPELDVSTENNATTVHLKTVRFGGWFGKNVLNIQISNKIPIELTINSGASSLDLDLSTINLQNLDINVGASSIDLEIGTTENNANIDISAGASSIILSAPHSLGIKLTSKTGISSKDFGELVKIDKQTYESYTFRLEGEKKVFINLDIGVSSFKFNTY